jgi:hypothetical protein
MEVHAHTHTPRKKWTHYLWEFLMLFLAVFCGFLAENQREHYVEHLREKQYIRSLISDVKTDTVNIAKMLPWYIRIQKACDTVLNNFEAFSKAFTEITGRNFYIITSGFPDFIYTDRTIQQLKNSGGMRLIRNTGATDSIIDYDAAVRDILIEEQGVSDYYDQMNDLKNKTFSYRKLSSALETKKLVEIENQKMNLWIKQDAEQFENLYNLIYMHRGIIRNYCLLLVQLKNKGARLVDFLQKEYHLK